MHATLPQVEFADGWRIVACNEALASLLGADRPLELVNRAFSDFVPDRILLDRLLAAMRAHGACAGSEIELRRIDGGSLVVVIVLTGDIGNDGSVTSLRALLAEAADTGRRNLLGAQRMEAVGRLAGGIAHDFNNLLMVISGHAERLLDKLPGEGAAQSSALAIQQATDRAASLTRQLLTFGRRQTLQARLTDLRAFVGGLRPRLEQLLDPGVELAVELNDVPPVSIDTVRLEDALASLVVNACTAMPNGGIVTIRTGTETVTDSASRPRQWIRPGSYVSLVVADTGHGMDDATKLRVFEPFFTTRGLRGAGLGLATVYGFVKQSHGYVFVDSEPGQGASFTILFPGAAPVRASQTAEARAATLETILIISDDEALRTRLGDAFRAAGYHVLDSPSGERAAEVFAAYTDRVHLLLVDTDGMGESGRTLVNRLRALDPLLQALYLVEPPGEGAASRNVADHPALLKPASIEATLARVRDALDTGEGR